MRGEKLVDLEFNQSFSRDEKGQITVYDTTFGITHGK